MTIIVSPRVFEIGRPKDVFFGEALAEDPSGIVGEPSSDAFGNGGGTSGGTPGQLEGGPSVEDILADTIGNGNGQSPSSELQDTTSDTVLPGELPPSTEPGATPAPVDDTLATESKELLDELAKLLGMGAAGTRAGPAKRVNPLVVVLVLAGLGALGYFGYQRYKARRGG